MAAAMSGRSKLILQIKNLFERHKQLPTIASRCMYGTSTLEEDLKDKNVSKAMKAYLERATAHDKFMKEQIAEFDIGKRHLANIMGEDPDSFTQDDIDEAIRYLLPSGLFEKKARPLMKHPEEVFPKRKAAQFGYDGRPFHSLFYTAKPNYYQIMHDNAWKLEELKKIEDDMIGKGHLYPPGEVKPLNLAGSQWITKFELEKKVIEPLTDQEYNRFLNLFTRVVQHPYASKIEDYVMEFRKPLLQQSITQALLPIKEDEDGTRYVESEGKRKTCFANLKLYEKGSGKITINHQEFYEFFPDIDQREQIIFPLLLSEKLGQVDFEVHVEGGGPSGKAGAIRFALSKALCSFVSEEKAEKMRIAGLLTWDPRKRERKKPGQWKARKKFTWKKR